MAEGGVRGSVGALTRKKCRETLGSASTLPFESSLYHRSKSLETKSLAKWLHTLVTGQVDHVQIGELFQHLVDQFRADPLPPVRSKNLQQRDVGTRHTVADGRYEPHDTVCLLLPCQDDSIAITKQSQMPVR